jgi:hypothetical protein
MTAAIRQLAYGVSPDAVDEYIKIGESTALASMKNFVQHIITAPIYWALAGQRLPRLHERFMKDS